MKYTLDMILRMIDRADIERANLNKEYPKVICLSCGAKANSAKELPCGH